MIKSNSSLRVITAIFLVALFVICEGYSTYHMLYSTGIALIDVPSEAESESESEGSVDQEKEEQFRHAQPTHDVFLASENASLGIVSEQVIQCEPFREITIPPPEV